MADASVKMPVALRIGSTVEGVVGEVEIPLVAGHDNAEGGTATVDLSADMDGFKTNLAALLRAVADVAEAQVKTS